MSALLRDPRSAIRDPRSAARPPSRFALPSLPLRGFGGTGRRGKLTHDEIRLLAAILVVQLALGTALRVVPVRTLWKVVSRRRATARRFVIAPDDKIAWAIEAVGRRLPGFSTCFVRALTADLLLGSSNEGHIKIGVRRSPAGTLESHAWFERNGRILVGKAGADEYADFTTLDTAFAEPV